MWDQSPVGWFSLGSFRSLPENCAENSHIAGFGLLNDFFFYGLNMMHPSEHISEVRFHFFFDPFGSVPMCPRRVFREVFTVETSVPTDVLKSGYSSLVVWIGGLGIAPGSYRGWICPEYLQTTNPSHRRRNCVLFAEVALAHNDRSEIGVLTKI